VEGNMERLTIKAPSGLIHLKDNTEMTMNVAIKKLSDFEDLEEQNRLLKLPCAVGDTVYEIFPNDEDGKIAEKEIVGFSSEAMMFYGNLFWTRFDKIGKTIFLTKEEAEAALKELERGKGE
jgi:hypothetical protein